MAILRALVLLALLASAADAGSVRVGDRAPIFAVTDRAGRATAVAARPGVLVCVDFWASWCAHCRTALPALDTLARRHPGRIEMLAVGIDRDRKAAERFLEKTLPDPGLTLVYDADGKTMARFAPEGIPALYVIDADGVVRLAAGGYGPEELPALERAIEALLPPSTP